jgi:CHAT domain-containing protein/tetratricopeptide (TPR) repeat protein
MLLAETDAAKREPLLAAERALLTPTLIEDMLSQGGRHQDAGDYRQALTIFNLTHAAARIASDRSGLAQSLNSIGSIYFLQGSFKEALDYYQQSLPINQELGNRKGAASTLANIAGIYSSQGNYTLALDSLQQCLQVFLELKAQTEAGIILNNISFVHYSLGDYPQALAVCRQALQISEALDHQLLRATTLGNIANIRKDQGDYRQALAAYQESLQISLALGDKPGAAITLNNIGLLWHVQGNYAQALEHYQKSLTLRKELQDQAGLVYTLNNIGLVHFDQGDFPRALENYQSGLQISEAIGDQVGRARLLGNLGLVHQRQGDADRALNFFQKSLAVSEASGARPEMAGCLKLLADVSNGLGRTEQALTFAGRAVELARLLGAPDLPEQARQALEEAIRTVEDIRIKVAGGEQDQQRFFESRITPYYAMVDLLLSRNDQALALSYAERAKSRTLVDVLQSGRAASPADLTAAEQEQERRLRNQLVSLNAQLSAERQSNQKDESRVTSLSAQLDKARLDYEAFQSNLDAMRPQLRAQRGEAKTITLEEAAALLPDARTALLEFVVAEDKTFLFVLTRNAPHSAAPVVLNVFTIEIRQKELAARVGQLRHLLSQRDNGFNRLSTQLYELLIGSAQALLRGRTSLVIVPDGPLWELPFQALLRPAGRYLVQDAAISLAPSLTALREMMKLRRKNVPAAGVSLLAFGNPALITQSAGRAAVMQDEKLEPLPDAEKQVRELDGLFGRLSPPARRKVYVGAEATEERLKAEAGDYSILHLATHGILDDRSPMYSHLALAQTTGSGNEDGLLEAWEILKMDLKAELAVLSACETARGRIGAGEGMIGLSWAMFVAGVPTTVVSQWKVRSDSTADLMVNFYQQLQSRAAKDKAGLSRAEAMRRAALRLLGTAQYRHPFHWAGFVVIGDGF